MIGSAISRVRNGIKEVSRDSVYTNRFIWNVILSNFTRLLNQRPNIHTLDVFTSLDLDVEEVNLLESSCVPLDCKGYRVKIEDALETKHGLLFRYIATPDLSETFTLVSPKVFQLKINKTKGNTHYAFLEDEYLYLNKYYPCIKVSYLSKYGSANDCCILNNDTNIPDYLLDAAVKQAIQEIAPSLQKPTDRILDKN